MKIEFVCHLKKTRWKMVTLFDGWKDFRSDLSLALMLSVTSSSNDLIYFFQFEMHCLWKCGAFEPLCLYYMCLVGVKASCERYIPTIWLNEKWKISITFFVRCFVYFRFVLYASTILLLFSTFFRSVFCLVFKIFSFYSVYRVVRLWVYFENWFFSL